MGTLAGEHMGSDGIYLLLISAITALLLGTAIRQLLRRVPIPYTVALLLCGLLLGAMARNQMFSDSLLVHDSVHYLANIEPHLILLLFLPIVVFQSSLSLDPHLFRRLLGQISLLAIPGVIIATLITAVLCIWLLPVEWSWPVALLFGALISATDPVAVVALLKEMGARHRLETLVEGESLLNDGTAIVLFVLFAGLITPDGSSSLSSAVLRFVYVVAGGAAVGYCTGKLLLYWMVKFGQEPLVQISLSIAAAYLSYLIAENMLHLSGVVSLVVLGTTLAAENRVLLQPKVAEFLQQFWQLMAHMANTLIFLIVGITIAIKIPLDGHVPWWIIIQAYVLVMLARAIMLGLLYPILKRSKAHFRWQKAVVLWWGSLRGAIALVLALTLTQNEALSGDTSDQILLLTAGIVAITLLVNAATVPRLLKVLGMDSLPPARVAAQQRAERLIELRLDKQMDKLKGDPLLAHANWASLREKLGVTAAGDVENGLQDISVEFLRQLLETEKQSYWHQYHHGYIGQMALRRLLNMVEHALDGETNFSKKASLESAIQVTGIDSSLSA